MIPGYLLEVATFKIIKFPEGAILKVALFFGVENDPFSALTA